MVLKAQKTENIFIQFHSLTQLRSFSGDLERFTLFTTFRAQSSRFVSFKHSFVLIQYFQFHSFSVSILYKYFKSNS